ncbi:MAG: ComEC/Rec2 family competence protein [Candidatus Pacebacteria bacterium]|nr:ComEC/Rec2 family competence protein [Candidatus Paceibacterota bacterium]
MTFSKVFFYFCIAFLFGTFLASFFTPNFIFYLLFLVTGFIIFIVFYKRKLAIIGLCLLVFLFGAFWQEKFESEIFPTEKDIHYYNNKGKFSVEGIILKELQNKEKSIEATIKVERVGEKVVKGNLLAFLEVGSKVKYGDKILLKEEIKEPENFTPEFNYKEYLRGKRIYSLMFYPEIKVLSSNHGNSVLSIIFLFKEQLKERAKILPTPEGAILSAITLGDKSRLSDNFKEKLSVSGLSHIVAISGMHIMIILGIFLFFFLFLGFWRREATIFSLILLFFYILLIGMSSSAIRAGIMGIFLYIGWAIGRLSRSVRSIVFAATAMVILNPLILARDVGFQLSFLAALGIIFLLPIFEKWLKAENSEIKKLICLTLAAQVLCLPVLIFNFGKIPVLAPISNILVVPFLPTLLISGFLFLTLALFSPYLAIYLSFVLKIIFSFVVFVVNFISSLPVATISFKIPIVFILVFYFIIGTLLFRKKRKILQLY